jgi:hypothetical protein
MWNMNLNNLILSLFVKIIVLFMCIMVRNIRCDRNKKSRKIWKMKWNLLYVFKESKSLEGK